MMNAAPHMPTIFPVTCHTDFVGIDTIFVAIEGYENGELWRQRIKAELKDSVSNEIFKTIQKNQMFL